MTDRAKTIGANVARERARLGLSQQDLAARIGVRSQNTIAAIETGKTKRSKYLLDIAKALNVSIFELDPSLRKVIAGVHSDDEQGPLHIDVFGARVDADQTVVMTDEPIDKVGRPAPLAAVENAYGVIIADERMVPALRPGDIALVHPNLVPRPDDLCLFSVQEEGRRRMVIKEYRDETNEIWRVRLYGPRPQDCSLRKADWPHCHVIIGKYTRR